MKFNILAEKYIKIEKGYFVLYDFLNKTNSFIFDNKLLISIYTDETRICIYDRDINLYIPYLKFFLHALLYEIHLDYSRYI